MDLARNEIEDRFRECFKVINSFLYFVLNYCWIEDKATSQAIPFNLWDSQRHILKKFLTAYRLILLKARQLGLTWLCAAYALWLCVTKPLQLVVVISAKEDWAIEFLDRVKFILDRLPAWMIPELTKRTGQTLEFKHQNNLLSTIKSLATTPEGAQSKTPTLLILDETSRNRYIKEIWASSKPGIDVAKGRIIIISNSIKDGVGWSWTRDIFTKSMTKINDFKRIFMPWWDHPGRSRKHFIEQQKAEGMDEEDISQHYPSTEQEAISTLLGSYFGKVLARHQTTLPGIRGYLAATKHKELEFIEDPKGIIELWRYPYHLTQQFDGVWWENRYAIGSDISEGLGETYSVAYVLDRKMDEIVCRVRSNRIDAYEWANMLFNLSRFYNNANGNALICPERTGAGITTCKRLQGLDANLYVKIIPAKAGNPVTKIIGWQETRESKHELCGDLKTWLRLTQGNVYCSLLIDECSTFIRHENGKLEHEEGKLDDCVMGAGCTVKASHFIGDPPKAVPEEATGWMKKWQEGRL